MKLERVWIAVVFLAWLSGMVVWAASDARGVPVASVWIWVGAVGLLSIPLVLALITLLIEILFKRRRQ